MLALKIFHREDCIDASVVVLSTPSPSSNRPALKIVPGGVLSYHPGVIVSYGNPHTFTADTPHPCRQTRPLHFGDKPPQPPASSLHSLVLDESHANLRDGAPLPTHTLPSSWRRESRAFVTCFFLRARSSGVSDFLSRTFKLAFA